MKCVKELSITIAAEEPPAPPNPCPVSQEITLTVASPRNTTHEIRWGIAPCYCYHVDLAMATGDLCRVQAGEPGMLGVLDTIVYALINGEATSGDATHVVDLTRSWPVNALAGKKIVFVSGTGSGGMADIASNTATAITLTAPYGAGIDNTTHYSIIMDSDDDGGPGVNSDLVYYAPFAETYTFQAGPFYQNEVGDISILFTCLIVDFSWDPGCPAAPPRIGQSVAFSDTTVPPADWWEWDFGDGSPHEHVQNPTHTFLTYDRSNASLCGSSIITLSARRGGYAGTTNWEISIVPWLKIKGWVPTWFVFNENPGDGCSALEHSLQPAWDGVIPSICGGPYTGCSWQISAVNLNDIVADVTCFRNFNLGLWDYFQITINFHYSGGLLANFIWTRVDSGSNNPAGVYTAVTPESICFPDRPDTLEIEYVP